MSDETIMRDALIWNQAELTRVIMDLQEENRDLKTEIDGLNHVIKCYRAEITARSAAAKQMRELLIDLEIELQAARYGRQGMGQDRLNEDGERTFAPNLEEEE